MKIKYNGSNHDEICGVIKDCIFAKLTNELHMYVTSSNYNVVKVGDWVWDEKGSSGSGSESYMNACIEARKGYEKDIEHARKNPKQGSYWF